MTPLILIPVAAAVAAGVVLLKRKEVQLPAGWTAITAGNDYGTKVEGDGSFDFPQAPSSVHYVTKGCGSLANAKGLKMTYTVEKAAPTQFHLMELQNGKETVTPAMGVTPVLYFERKGDDWSGDGSMEAYRWWATFNACLPLAPGDYELTAMFDERWTAVETSNSIDQAASFRAALAEAGRVGFTFPGATGYGHGVTAIGKARFTLKSFEIL